MRGDREWTVGGAAALETAAPAAVEALCAVVAGQATSLGAATIGAIRSVTSGANGLPALGGPVADAGALDAVVRAFAEQFSIDVSSIDDGQRAEMSAVLGENLFDALQAIYVADFVPRLYAALDAVFGTSTWSVPDAFRTDDTWSLIDALAIEVARLSTLDAVTTELVRLRGARQHQCRLCKSLRNVTALREGADDATLEAIDSYADSALAPKAKAALALTDAMIWTPARIDPVVIDSVRASLAPIEVVEVALDVTRNAANKIAVALGADAAAVADGAVALFDVDAEGKLTYL